MHIGMHSCWDLIQTTFNTITSKYLGKNKVPLVIIKGFSNMSLDFIKAFNVYFSKTAPRNIVLFNLINAFKFYASRLL